MFHATVAPRHSPIRWPRRLLPAVALLILAGCNYHYIQGVSLEAEERWEEAAIEYRLAWVDDPDDPDFIAALDRANKVVSRENFDRYRVYLAEKKFPRAYARLLDSARQDPGFAPTQAELVKWQRILISGQVEFSFQSLRGNLSLADEIRLVARVNTPNPGEVIEAEIDIDTGIFFVEDLLYEPPDTLLTYYTINSIGVILVRGKTTRKQFTNTDFVRFVNFRTPILDTVEGRLGFPSDEPLLDVRDHRKKIGEALAPTPHWTPRTNLHYSLSIRDDTIDVQTDGNRGDFTPRFLYLNRRNNRMFVDFGRYELRQNTETRRWGLTRLPLAESDYFGLLWQNIALKPYFFYHGKVFQYVPSDRG